jgi:NTE family protein
MTDSSAERRRHQGVALALSGGGFRATLFHIGSLRRLLELGVLEKIRHVASVSGGSITAGVLAHQCVEQPTASWTSRIDELELTLRRFCSKTIDTGSIVGGILNPFSRAGDLLASQYEQLFGKVALSNVSRGPEFTFCATNLQTGRLVHLVKDGIVDYRIGKTPQTVSLARAVAASSAFPPFLSPVVVKVDEPWTPVGTLSTFNADARYTRKLYLTDGGAYDNMGLEPVWDRYETVLVSDAGAPYQSLSEVDTDWLHQMHAAFEIATDQARGVRKRWLVEQFARQATQGTYWGINTRLANYELADAVAYPADKSARLAGMRTRLDAFSKAEQDDLIDWGYVVCDAAMRRWCPAVCTAPAKPARLPGSGMQVT